MAKNKMYMVKVGSSKQFFKDNNQIFRNGVPKTYLEFGDIIEKNEGKIFKLDREYGERAVLLYNKPRNKNVVGFDIEKKYLKEVK